MELSGNKIRANRPISNPKLRRPESEYSRHRYEKISSVKLTFYPRKQYDNNPRYRYDNIVTTELDMPERTTQVICYISYILSMERNLKVLEWFLELIIS